MNDLINRLRIFGGEPDTGNTYHEAADRIEQLEATCKDHGEIQQALCNQLTEAKKLIEQLVESLGICLAEISAWRVESYCDDFNSPDVNEALAAAKQFRERNV